MWQSDQHHHSRRRTSIDDYTFMCKSLTSIEIPSSVTSIGVEAFCGCSGLRSITIPEGVTSIGRNAFSRCKCKVTLTLSSSVTEITHEMIEPCRKYVNQIIIPNGVYIDWRECIVSLRLANYHHSSKRHRNWTGGTHMTAPVWLTSLFPRASRPLMILHSSAARVWRRFPYQMLSRRLASVHSIAAAVWLPLRFLVASQKLEHGHSCAAPVWLTSLFPRASHPLMILHSRLQSLTAIEIPSSVTSIGDEAFCGCSGLRSITSEGHRNGRGHQ